MATAGFRSFFQGGFECSCQLLPDGRRLDLVAATGHARHAAEDYAALARHGIHTARDGIRWHDVERAPGVYDWSGFLPVLRAARQAGVQVVWDLCHYGWPDHLDIWSADFVSAFGRYAAAAATLVRRESPDVPYYCPVNEISFWSWAGGDMELFAPQTRERGMELKRQLVRASIAAMDAIRAVERRARFVIADPVIHVLPLAPADAAAATHAREAQFEAWDMLAGKAAAELGGGPAYLDIVGVNYYSDNQWYLGGGTIEPGHPAYRPLREILLETHRRYGRPMAVTETGAEGEMRVPWLRYVCDEVAAALHVGVPMQGICLYPVTDYPGWGDDRHCPTGLFGPPCDDGQRPVHWPLADELAVQQRRYAASDPRTGCGAQAAR